MPGISYEFLRDSTDIESKVYHEGTEREYFMTWCPWHPDEEQMSLMVRPGDPMDSRGREHTGYWRCLAGCGVGGVDDLWRKLKGWSRPRQRRVPTAISWSDIPLTGDVEQLERVIQTGHMLIKSYPELSWYVRQRGLEDRIDPCFLGNYNGWITIPVFTRNGTLRTVVARSTPPVQEVSGRRFHSPPLPPALFVPDWSLTERRSSVFVVFGMFDALSLASLRMAGVTPTHGNDSLTVEMIYGCGLDKKEIIVIPDQPAHEIETARSRVSVMQAAGLNCKMVLLEYPDGMKDVNDFLRVGRGEDLLAQIAKYDPS
jgi:hypothetical protein